MPPGTVAKSLPSESLRLCGAHGWNVVTDGYRIFRKDRQKRARGVMELLDYVVPQYQTGEFVC